MDIGNPLEIMFNDQAEVDFLLANLKHTDTVLEWGSGGSTLEIAKHVTHLYSVEHEKEWIEKVKPLLPINASVFHIPQNMPSAPGADGTYDEFKNYIEFPKKLFTKPDLSLMKMDVIFIDGRARVECARAAVELLKPGGIILIHDYRNPTEQYRRYEYEVVEQFLTCTEGAYALWKFKPKSTPISPKGGGRTT